MAFVTGTAMAIAALAAAGGATAGAALQSRASNKAARYASDAANRASDIEAKSATDALTFAREQEAERKREWQATQDLNYGIWRAREANLRPFRAFGMGALGQLAQPIPGLDPTQQGTLGQIAGGR